MQSAIVITGGSYCESNAKTAHGLVRGGDRFKILGIIDRVQEQGDAGVLLDGQSRNIPIFATVEQAKDQIKGGPLVAVVGIATHGGVITDELRSEIKSCLRAGMDVVSGLHQHMASDTELVALAKSNHAKLIDIRKADAKRCFWSGKILDLDVPRIAVLGTDCALGKRTTARMMVEEYQRRKVQAELIYTGQTGWLQGGKFGFIFDATPNDFVSGELERAIWECFETASPSLMIIEGQSALRNPSGPCGSEILLSAGVKHVVLQHAPQRRYFDGTAPRPENEISLAKEMRLIELYGSEVVAVSLNSEGIKQDDIEEQKRAISEEIKLPVIAPMYDGVGKLVDAVNLQVGPL